MDVQRMSGCANAVCVRQRARHLTPGAMNIFVPVCVIGTRKYNLSFYLIIDLEFLQISDSHGQEQDIKKTFMMMTVCSILFERVFLV
jgi:hypothetical protein